MKHWLRDRYIDWLWYSGAVARYRDAEAAAHPLVRVVAFHDITNETWFRSTIDLFLREYHLLAPEDFMTMNVNANKLNLLLTFDDGYQSWIDIVRPVLAQYNIRALFFISSGLLDGADDPIATASFMRERLYLTVPRTPLTWDGARLLLEYGHELGGHTASHANLAALQGRALEEDIVADKARIEQMCQLKLASFAYPFGTAHHITPAARATARAAGYTTTFSAIPGFASGAPTEDTPRLLLEEGQSSRQLMQWIEGGYDLFYQRKMRYRQDM